MAADTLSFKKMTKVVGIKQSIKAVEKGSAVMVYVAENADSRLIFPLQQACANRGVPVVTGHSLEELGKACGIDVGAAAVTILE